ncbi:MAG: hypothetical protein KAU20_03970 [Nanoarchaeota archaeon]|nr:hypothetical protein [Nanoarchaeota archaeon]
MNPKTTLTYFFFFLLVLPVAYSVTLEELINSYDYDYSSDQINITGFTHYGNDTDGNNLSDYLIINITINNNESNYTFIGDLYRDGALITTISDTYYLESGQNTVPLYYNAKLLQNGTYNLSLTIQENYLTIYRNNTVYNFSFDNNEYEKPDVNIEINSYEPIDNDTDSKYEILRINAIINSTVNGTFEINALIANSKSINSKKNYSLINGTNNISIDFDGKEIRKERINNSRLYSITIKNGINYQFDFNYSLNYNLYDFDAGQSILNDSYSDGKIDLNGNNLSEFLEINISLDINESGAYSIELELDDLYDNYVKKISREFNLNASDQKVSFRINGTYIYNSKINSPYVLNYVELSKDNITLDSVSTPYTTGNYTYDDFERPSMPDLVIKSLKIKNETNVEINLSNQGEGCAFAFNIELFDDDFNSIEEGLLSYLAQGDSEILTYDVNTSNISKLYAIVDYDDNIEESNESNNLFTKDLGEALIGFNISLSKGWNLISSPLNFTNITEVFNPIEPYFVSLFSYDNKEKEFFEANPFTFEGPFDSRGGAWLKVSENTTLNITGDEWPMLANIPLFQGWNLIGYPSLNETEINNSDLKNHTIFTYINNSWLSYAPDKPSFLNTLKKLIPGYGYWVKVC